MRGMLHQPGGYPADTAGSLPDCKRTEAVLKRIHRPVLRVVYRAGFALSDHPAESSEAPVIEYFYMNPGCGNNTRTQTIREWFDSFGIPLNDDFFIEWSTFQKNFVTLIREVERFLDEATMRQLSLL